MLFCLLPLWYLNTVAVNMYVAERTHAPRLHCRTAAICKVTAQGRYGHTAALFFAFCAWHYRLSVGEMLLFFPLLVFPMSLTRLFMCNRQSIKALTCIQYHTLHEAQRWSHGITVQFLLLCHLVLFRNHVFLLAPSVWLCSTTRPWFVLFGLLCVRVMVKTAPSKYMYHSLC